MTDAVDKVKTSLFEWIGRAMIGLVVFFAYNIYCDVKTLVTIVPVLQEKIQMLEKRQERLENKVYKSETFIYHGEMLKADEVTLNKPE